MFWKNLKNLKNDVLTSKWPKNEVFGPLKKIESKDLAENGLE